jgi:DNA polymerase-4
MSEVGRDGGIVPLARSLKRDISAAVGLTASIGVGQSKLVAKLASAYDKPDGLTVIQPNAVQRFLDPLPVRRLPGVGPTTGGRLHDAGILTIGQLRRAPLEWLRPILGRQADSFQARAAGIDPREVSPVRARRSVSQESTFDRDLHDLGDIEAVIRRQAAKCSERLAQRALYAKTVHLKLRSGGFSTLTRSMTLTGYTRATEPIAGAAVELARAWAGYQTHVGVRLIGVGVSSLTPNPDSGQLLRAGDD